MGRVYLKKGRVTWAAVRAGFCAGESAPVLAEKYGVGVKAIYARSSKEGWMKAACAQAQAAFGEAEGGESGWALDPAAAAVAALGAVDVEADGCPVAGARLAVALSVAAARV